MSQTKGTHRTTVKKNVRIMAVQQTYRATIKGKDKAPTGTVKDKKKWN
jgi:hypothetical protein